MDINNVIDDIEAVYAHPVQATREGTVKRLLDLFDANAPTPAGQLDFYNALTLMQHEFDFGQEMDAPVSSILDGIAEAANLHLPPRAWMKSAPLQVRRTPERLKHMSAIRAHLADMGVSNSDSDVIDFALRMAAREVAKRPTP